MIEYTYKAMKGVVLFVSNQQIKVELIEKLRAEHPVLHARLGISQEKVSEIIGIGRQTYNAIETGKKK